MVSRGKVDIVIVNLNGKHHLEKCLPSIVTQSNSTLHQIAIIDNGSTDSSIEWVASRFPSAKIIKNASNMGFSKACNQGIEALNGDYILLLNNDTEFLNDVLENLVGFLENHDDAGLVGPLIFYPNGEIQASIKRFPPVWKYVMQQLGIAVLFARDRRNYYPFGPFRAAEYREWHEVEWLSGASLMFRRELFNEIGALDEQMPFGLEDMDYARRARSHGYKNYFVPAARIVHQKGGTHGQSGQRKPNAYVMKAYSQGIKTYFRKHHSSPAYLIVRFAMLVGRFLKFITGYS
jgi:O-antigen biosynthesis protein